MKNKKNNGENQIFLKKLLKLSRSKVNDITKEMHEEVSSYSKGSPIHSKNFIDLRQTNELFFKDFKNSKKMDKLGTSDKSSPNPSVFNELFTLYKKRGYKIPKLSLDHNIFENNPLLNSDNAIKEYYSSRYKNEKLINVEKTNEKNLVYLNKLNSILFKKQDKKLFRSSPRKRKFSVCLEEKPDVDVNNYEKENKEIQRYITTISNFLEEDSKTRKSFSDRTKCKVYPNMIRNSKTKKNTFVNHLLTPTKGDVSIIQKFTTQSNEIIREKQKRFSISKLNCSPLDKLRTTNAHHKTVRGVMITNVNPNSPDKQNIFSEKAPNNKCKQMINSEEYPVLFTEDLKSLSRGNILKKLFASDSQTINIHNKDFKKCINYYLDKYKTHSKNRVHSQIFSSDWSPEKMVQYSKSIARQVKSYNVAEIWKTNSSRVGKYDLMEDKLNQIEKLDKTLSTFDYYIVKKIAPKN